MKIQTDAGLDQTIEQIHRMYRVLSELHARMGKSDPALFRLFAEGPIDQIGRLRREVEEYLGIQESEDETKQDLDAQRFVGFDARQSA